MITDVHHYSYCRRTDWLNYEFTTISRKCIQVRDICNDVVEKLEFPERIIQTMIGYKRVIVVTPAQCYIYSVNNFNTPHIMELKEGSVSVILIAEKYVK